MNFYSEKEVYLNDAIVHLHYANNLGRGSDNVTLTFVKYGTERPSFTREYKEKDILNQYRVSGWKGKVNIPSKDIKAWGGLI